MICGDNKWALGRFPPFRIYHLSSDFAPQYSQKNSRGSNKTFSLSGPTDQINPLRTGLVRWTLTNPASILTRPSSGQHSRDDHCQCPATKAWRRPSLSLKQNWVVEFKAPLSFACKPRRPSKLQLPWLHNRSWVRWEGWDCVTWVSRYHASQVGTWRKLSVSNRRNVLLQEPSSLEDKLPEVKSESVSRNGLNNSNMTQY